MSFARLDVWIAIIQEFFSKWEARGGHHQERYADIFGRKIELAVEQIVGQIRVIVYWWEPEELMVLIKSEDEVVRNTGLLGTSCKATVVVKFAKQQ